jgi:hypothetical protein
MYIWYVNSTGSSSTVICYVHYAYANDQYDANPSPSGKSYKTRKLNYTSSNGTYSIDTSDSGWDATETNALIEKAGVPVTKFYTAPAPPPASAPPPAPAPAPSIYALCEFPLSLVPSGITQFIPNSEIIVIDDNNFPRNTIENYNKYINTPNLIYFNGPGISGPNQTYLADWYFGNLGNYNVIVIKLSNGLDITSTPCYKTNTCKDFIITYKIRNCTPPPPPPPPLPPPPPERPFDYNKATSDAALNSLKQSYLNYYGKKSISIMGIWYVNSTARNTKVTCYVHFTAYYNDDPSWGKFYRIDTSNYTPSDGTYSINKYLQGWEATDTNAYIEKAGVPVTKIYPREKFIGNQKESFSQKSSVYQVISSDISYVSNAISGLFGGRIKV